jgi:hypothetical protein
MEEWVPPFSQRWLAPVELRLGRVLGGEAGGAHQRLAGPAAVGSAAAAGEAMLMLYDASLSE